MFTEPRPREVWCESKKLIRKEKSHLLICDDTVLSKKHSKKIEMVQHQYSGNEHSVIAGIGLVNLLYCEVEQERRVPIDYRIYDKKTDGKGKNVHFRQMLKIAKARGLSPEAVVMDTWYSGLKNLKSIRDIGWNWVTTLRKNRKVNKNVSLESLHIPDGGLQVHLRGYGMVTVFKFVAKNGRIGYVATNIEQSTRSQIQSIFKARWSIEVYHRELKQTSGIERCQARTGRAQRNHICLAIKACIDRYVRLITQQITLYQQTWQSFKDIISFNIQAIMSTTP